MLELLLDGEDDDEDDEEEDDEEEDEDDDDDGDPEGIGGLEDGELLGDDAQPAKHAASATRQPIIKPR